LEKQLEINTFAKKDLESKLETEKKKAKDLEEIIDSLQVLLVSLIGDLEQKMKNNLEEYDNTSSVERLKTELENGRGISPNTVDAYVLFYKEKMMV